MSPNEPRRPAGWKPDDKVIEGRIGAARVAAAFKKHGIVVKNRVITSQDKGMDDVRFDLRREDMPPGIQSWQLPVVLDESTLVFLTVAEPGAIVPTHVHKRDLFRVVLSGSIFVNGDIELKTADWMYVPKGTPYSYHAAFNPGAVTLHFYC
ncbi:MAG TPA: cupin domain-containing protein [Candidatus Dormibacteraeota bacterium]|nr:cupin domain-containing protein [Candidatus Dormibacteraeota bacterium]